MKIIYSVEGNEVSAIISGNEVAKALKRVMKSHCSQSPFKRCTVEGTFFEQIAQEIVGKAKCNVSAGDRMDLEYGKKLARSRALAKLEGKKVKLLQHAWNLYYKELLRFDEEMNFLVKREIKAKEAVEAIKAESPSHTLNFANLAEGFVGVSKKPVKLSLEREKVSKKDLQNLLQELILKLFDEDLD